MSQRADYNYNLDSLYGQKFMVLTDLDLGHRPLKEDLENSVAEVIANDTRITNPLEDWKVIYEDSNGGWHGWDQTTKEQVFLGKDTHKEAMEHYLELDKTKHVKTCKGNCAVNNADLPGAVTSKYIKDSNFL